MCFLNGKDLQDLGECCMKSEFKVWILINRRLWRQHLLRSSYVHGGTFTASIPTLMIIQNILNDTSDTRNWDIQGIFYINGEEDWFNLISWWYWMRRHLVYDYTVYHSIAASVPICSLKLPFKLPLNLAQNSQPTTKDVWLYKIIIFFFLLCNSY